MTGAQRQARYRCKLALKKRKQLCARLGIDPRVLESGVFPALAAAGDDVEADEVIALEPGDAMTLTTPTAEDWARLIYRPDEG